MEQASIPRFLPLRQAARRLGVPAAWLREEAEAGSVPHLRAGKRLLFHLPTLEAELLAEKLKCSVAQKKTGEEAKLPGERPLLLDARAAAALCGVSRSHFLALHAAGKVPLPVRLGRRTLWPREELVRWIKHGCPPRDRWHAAMKGQERIAL